MFKYDQKLIISGNYIEKYVYSNMIFKGLNSASQAKGSSSTSEITLREKRLDNLRETQAKLRRLINANPQLDKFITLTFSQNITELQKANLLFKKFRQRLEYTIERKFQYVNVVEFQRRGAVHYHMLCDLDYMPSAELADIWQNGFIKINRINHVNNIGAYVCKYLTKEAMKLLNKKKFMYSPSLNRPETIFDRDLIDLIENSDKFKTAELQYQGKFESPFCGEILYKQFKI